MQRLRRVKSVSGMTIDIALTQNDTLNIETFNVKDRSGVMLLLVLGDDCSSSINDSVAIEDHGFWPCIRLH